MGPTYKVAIYLSTITATLHTEVCLNILVSPPVKGKKRHKTASFTKRLFDLDAPANVLWLTQSAPLAAALSRPQGHPPYGVTVRVQGYCYTGGIGIVFTVHGGDSAHDLLPCCIWVLPPVERLCRSVPPTSAVTRILSSPLIGVLHGLLEMSSENKHRMKDGKTRDISQRNTMARRFLVISFHHFPSCLHWQTQTHTYTHTRTSLQWAALWECFLPLVNKMSESTFQREEQQQQAPYWFISLIQNRVM